ncbi:hypothetical protein AB434_3691 [Heyndrickxia coagulans]|uniref:Uncharacterized protein n=1 Tax=Heyndrickxia coagulans TaxID=1398 RepID=A0AAN0T774_HEYCO|nr:hypothetical protein SB48_HM08orf02482 [Heyndrickxia coagulans]AKN56096.1 hypothetical protein AB434_3691 [Heyndrickxia coagulans]
MFREATESEPIARMPDDLFEKIKRILRKIEQGYECFQIGEGKR